ncbi:MAG: hypothetical protein ABIA74_04310 [bacterium]
MKFKYLFFILHILFFYLNSMSDLERLHRMEKREHITQEKAGEVKEEAKEVIDPSSFGKFGFAHLSQIRNQTKDPLKISSSSFLTKNSSYERILKIKPNETSILNFDALIDGSYIRIEGFGQSNVTGLVKGSAIKVNAGYAWLDKSFEKQNQATVVFGARPYLDLANQNIGKIEIVLGGKISTDYDYKIVIGDEKNTTSYILKKDKTTGKEKIVYKIETKTNPLSKITSGKFETYWISLYKNLILVGKGQPGQNIFMSFYDTDYSDNIYRFGFGAGKISVDYSGIQLIPPVIAQKSWQPYFEQDGNPEIKGVKGNFNVLKTPFKVPGSGCISFYAKGNSGIAIAFGDKFEYQLLIGADANSRTLLVRNGVVVISIMSDVNPEIVLKDPEKFNHYWISINDGFVLFGKGDPGQNLMFAWKDDDPITISNQIAIGLPVTTFKIKGNPDCKNIELGSSINLNVESEQDYYHEKKELYKYPDSFTVINPFKYELFQDRQIVGVKDLVLEKNYDLAKITQDKADYYLMMIIEPDGTPKIQNSRGPEPSEETVSLAKNAYILKMGSQEALEVGEYVSWGAGRGGGGMISMLGSQLYLGIGKTLSVRSLAMEEQTKLGYQTPEEYAFIEAVPKPSVSDYKPSDEAVKNKKLVDDSLEEIRFYQDPELILVTYSYILNFINDFYVIDDYNKKKIQEAVEFLYNYGLGQVREDDYYKKLLKLLLDVRDNPYLVDLNNPEDLSLKKQWHYWANQIALYLMQKENKSDEGVKIPPTFGEPFWIPAPLPELNKGKISFYAKGLHDIYVCFSPEKNLIRNSDISFYEIVIRGWNGTKSAIRTTSLGKSVSEFQHIAQIKTEKGLEYELDPNNLKVLAENYKFRKYVVSFNDGHIIVLEDDKKILDWQDPYPIKNIKYVGIGSWDVYVNFRDIMVGKVLK